MNHRSISSDTITDEQKELLTKTFCESFESIVKTKLLFADVKTVVAGISGGADSVAMLLALKAADVETYALHCNFGLRGEEAERDTVFVRQLCARIGMKLDVRYVDARKYMAVHNVSAEVACRDLRYDLFRRKMSELGADRIAVAHNRDDQAETLLLNLMRGAGVAGLRGMKADTGEIIRPLLSISRYEIENYLKYKKQDYVTDSTNLQSDYNRNFLRNELIPLLRTRWPNAVDSICRTAAIMRGEEKVLDRVKEHLIPDPHRLDFKSLDSGIDINWIIDRFARPLGANRSQRSEILYALLRKDYQPGKVWHTDKGRICAERDALEFIPDKQDCEDDDKSKMSITCHKFKVTPKILEKMRTSGLDLLWTTAAPDDLDFSTPDKRDRFEPLGMKGSTTVGKIMKDAGLTRARKESVIGAYLKSDGSLIWIAGLKRSRHSLVRPDSEFVWMYEIEPMS